MSLSLIRELGAEIERSWTERECDLEAFPGLCADRLQAARLHERIEPDEIVRAVLTGDLPQQSDPEARFGQPPVTLYRGRRFFIDALFWVDGTTTIHDHAFSGAFQVLHGQSIETDYAFAATRELGGHVRLGGLSVLGTALRRKGDVQAVPSGPAYIHSLFHLARPSVSLLVRTYKDPSLGAQFNYSSAGIAFDPFLEDPLRERMIQIAEMMRKTDDPRFEERVGDLLAGVDAHTAFSVIRACMKVADATLLDRLVARIRDRELALCVGRWVVERRRTAFLMTRRATVHDPSLRFLLAVLLNSKRRVDVLALVASFSPGADPPRQIAAWLRELSTTRMRLQVGNSPIEPNVLALPPFGPGCEEALAQVLAGREDSPGPEVAAFLERLRALPALHPLFDL